MTAYLRRSFGRAGLPLWGTFLSLCACALPLVSDQRQQIVVVSVSGDWTQVRQSKYSDDRTTDDDLKRPVRFGQTLSVGEICLFGTEAGSIVLRYLTSKDNTLYPFPCEKANLGGTPTCAVGPREACAVDLRTLGKKPGIPAAVRAYIFEAMVRVVSAQPEKYMVAGSRGAEAELADAVVPLESGQIDVQAIFRDMSPDTYYVELAPLESASFSGPPSRVTYTKGQAARFEARGVRVGLYKLALVTEKGEPGDSDCWILVAAGPQYTERAAAYQQAVRESAKLPEEMDAGATRGLLRAYMEALSRAKQEAPRP
jgi:hypothetical protein